MVIAVHLPDSLQNSLTQKYGATTTVRTRKRTLSFERDTTPPVDNTVQEDDVQMVRAVVCIVDRMPPQPTLGITRDVPRGILNCIPDDLDITNITFSSIPNQLYSMVLRTSVPRTSIKFERRDRYRAFSILDPCKTLCLASDVRIARTVVAISILDEHISHVTCALRQFIDDLRLLKKWISSVDPESVTCRS